MGETKAENERKIFQKGTDTFLCLNYSLSTYPKNPVLFDEDEDEVEEEDGERDEVLPPQVLEERDPLVLLARLAQEDHPAAHQLDRQRADREDERRAALVRRPPQRANILVRLRVEHADAEEAAARHVAAREPGAVLPHGLQRLSGHLAAGLSVEAREPGAVHRHVLSPSSSRLSQDLPSRLVSQGQ